jgi:hypothetical protein
MTSERREPHVAFPLRTFFQNQAFSEPLFQNCRAGTFEQRGSEVFGLFVCAGDEGGGQMHVSQHPILPTKA